MRALVAQGPNRFAVCEVPTPKPGNDDVIVKIEFCAICGSDIKLLMGRMGGVGFPLIPGHEWSGTVVDAGSSQKSLIGCRVVAELLENCATCNHCVSGRRNLCSSLTEPGISRDGAFAEYLRVPSRFIRHIPDKLPLRLAWLAEPLAVLLYALERVPLSACDKVLILGSGGIGLLLLQLVRLAGVTEVVVADTHEARRAIASRLGATEAVRTDLESISKACAASLGGAPSVVFEACGNAKAFETALTLVAPAGRIGVIGYSGEQQISIAPSTIMLKLLDIYGILSPTGSWERAIELLTSGEVNGELIATHEFSLDQFSKAFEIASHREDGSVRVVIRP
jgi:2-desacetyl-2-hydroxyethyl bacteriochlorophyllide A dehydrogenase